MEDIAKPRFISNHKYITICKQIMTYDWTMRSDSRVAHFSVHNGYQVPRAGSGPQTSLTSGLVAENEGFWLKFGFNTGFVAVTAECHMTAAFCTDDTRTHQGTSHGVFERIHLARVSAVLKDTCSEVKL